MQLPEDDETYLNSKGYAWRLLSDGNGACLVISNFAVSTALFDSAQTELMIRIPAQYNIAGLDMFYVAPEIKLRSTGEYPEAASTFEDHCGQRWQRFSRHLTTTPWRAGVDGLPMFLALIQKELQAKG
ncbi:MAG: E2/UBC family protein [Acidobacteriota bacterium]